MSLKDDLAMQKIREVNDMFEQAIDKTLSDKNLARKITLLDGVWEKSPLIPSLLPGQISTPNPLVEYKNYYLGKEASTIRDPLECTIARGSSGSQSAFGRAILTEANAGYDVNTTEQHVSTLSGDTNTLVSLWRSAAYACFTPAGIPKIESYYGGNSLLRIAGTTIDPTVLFSTPPSGTSLRGFSLPIFSS
jgi:hypothetical protein